MWRSYLVKVGTDDVEEIDVHVQADDPEDAIQKVREVLGDEVTVKCVTDSDRPHGPDLQPAPIGTDKEKRRRAWLRMIWPS